MLSRWFQASRLLLVSGKGGAPRSLVATLVNGVAAAISGMFLSRLLGAVAQALVVRRLGLTLYGEYAALAVSLSLFAGLLGLGLDTWLLQEGGRDPANVSVPMRQVLALKALAAVLLLVVLAFVWSSRITQASAFVIGAVGIIFESFAQTGYSALRVRRQNALVALFQTITPALLLLVLLLLARTSISVLLLVSIQASFSVLMAVVVLTRIWHARRRGIERPRIDVLAAVRKGWLFVAAEGLSNIYTQAGMAILGSAVGTLALGTFSPAMNLIMLTFLVPNLLFAVGLPLLMAPTISPHEYRRIIALMLAGSVAYGLAALLALWFFGYLLIRLVYGGEFAPALPYVRIMALIPLLKSCSFVWVAILLAHVQQRLRVVLQAITVLASLALGWLVIPSYGAAGTAWVYVGLELLLFVLYGLGAWYVSRRRHL